MAEINLMLRAHVRRGAIPFLFVVNAFRVRVGLSVWVPRWLIVVTVKPYAS